ncbi:MAG: hypothetical protein V1744_07460 [Candidatus Altiarchaeota archaeon]
MSEQKNPKHKPGEDLVQSADVTQPKTTLRGELIRLRNWKDDSDIHGLLDGIVRATVNKEPGVEIAPGALANFITKNKTQPGAQHLGVLALEAIGSNSALDALLKVAMAPQGEYRPGVYAVGALGRIACSSSPMAREAFDKLVELTKHTENITFKDGEKQYRTIPCEAEIEIWHVANGGKCKDIGIADDAKELAKELFKGRITPDKFCGMIVP